MTVRTRTLRIGLNRAGADIVSLGLAFTRNVLFARILTAQDYGICVLLAAALSGLEVISDLGVEKMLIQDRSSPDEELQATIAALQILRGLLLASILYLLAEPFASSFGADHAAGAFKSLAIVFLCRSLFHLDPKRKQREFEFGLETRVILAVSIAEFAVGAAAVLMTHSFFALPLAAIAGSIAGTLTSHYVADRSFRIGWNPKIVRGVLRFGWPLMANGVVLLLMAQADRLIIARALSLESVAVYGVCVTVVSTPVLIGVRFIGTFGLPHLSEAVDDPAVLRLRLQRLGCACIAAGAAILIPIVLLGGPMIKLLFGARYNPPELLVATLAIGQSAILFRVQGVLGALAVGDTKNLLLGNLARVIGFCAALLAAFGELGLFWITAGFAAGEFLSMAYSAIRAERYGPGMLRTVAPLLTWFYFSIGLATVSAHSMSHEGFVASAATAFGLVITFLIIGLAISRDLRVLSARFLALIGERLGGTDG